MPPTSPAPQIIASVINLPFQRTADGVAQVMMNGATTRPASAFGTHQTSVLENKSSHFTSPL